MITHQDLVDRAVRWLNGTKRCNVTLSGIASAREIPDAIGWSTSWRQRGSILVECKTTPGDFYANKQKKHGNRLGRYRYFMVPVNLIGRDQVENNYPDHGLLYLDRNRVYVIREAPERSDPDWEQEVRLLQFAIVHMQHNLLMHGCSVNLCQLTKRYGGDGITMPQPLTSPKI